MRGGTRFSVVLGAGYWTPDTVMRYCKEVLGGSGGKLGVLYWSGTAHS